jgi:type II secretory pathway component PulJ
MPNSSPLRSRLTRAAPRSGASGFTLIEMLVTVGLAVMVIALTFSSLYYSARASRDSRIRTNLDFEFMKVFAQMRQQLINFYLSPVQESSLLGVKGKEERTDELHFFTASPVIGRGIVEAAYGIRKSEDDKSYLVYKEFPYTRKLEILESTMAPQFDEDRWRKVTDAVVGLSFDYESNEKLFDEWKDNRPPDRIIVALWYTAEQEVKSFTFSVTPGIIASTPSTSPTPSSSEAPAAPPSSAAPPPPAGGHGGKP